MKKYSYYNPYTGYGYVLSEHAKLRIWERFRTLDIEKEFKQWHYLMVQDNVDDLVAEMNDKDHIIIEDITARKVYVVVLDDCNVILKTVYKNTKRFFLPNEETNWCKYQIMKDGTIRKWRNLLHQQI